MSDQLHKAVQNATPVQLAKIRAFGDHWDCPRCRFVNPIHRLYCIGCSLRGGDPSDVVDQYDGVSRPLPAPVCLGPGGEYQRDYTPPPASYGFWLAIVFAAVVLLLGAFSLSWAGGMVLGGAIVWAFK